MKKIYKATNIEGVKQIKIDIINKDYSDTMVEARVTEGIHIGKMTTISKCFITEYVTNE